MLQDKKADEKMGLMAVYQKPRTKVPHPEFFDTDQGFRFTSYDFISLRKMLESKFPWTGRYVGWTVVLLSGYEDP